MQLPAGVWLRRPRRLQGADDASSPEDSRTEWWPGRKEATWRRRYAVISYCIVRA